MAKLRGHRPATPPGATSVGRRASRSEYPRCHTPAARRAAGRQWRLPLRLTLKGVARCKGSAEEVDLFLRTLRWMALQERKFAPTTATEAAAPTVDSKQLMRGLQIPNARAAEVYRLRAILLVEQWGHVGGGRNTDQTWTFTLSQEVRRF